MTDLGGGRRLGWLGTGRMGIALIDRLLAAGCDVTVYNRTKAKAEPLAQAGAKVVDVAADLAGVDILFVTVGTSQDLIDALVGPAGLISGGRKPPSRSGGSWRRMAAPCSPLPSWAIRRWPRSAG
jgi:3-hydroxyisobutyrate dehydrogenase